MSKRIPPVLAALVAAAILLPGAGAQERRLGTIDFPNSGSAAAQDAFIEGVLLLHSFEFEDAALEFRRAQEIDGDFALAYWGEAMTYNHPLWRQQDRDAALAALRRYAPTAAARQAKAPTPREAAYLAALDELYGEGTKSERDRAYMEAMAELAAAYPDDLEAAAFHSLAVLGSTDGERDFATYERAAAIAQPVFESNPDHPGAAHYLIHSFDDPVHAPLGLPAARAYSEIAPDAGHAQHMTSHIFVAMGMWDDVVAANIRARDVQDARRAELGRPANVCGHYTSWLHYGWLQRGEVEAAARGMSACHELVASGKATGEEVGYFVNMRARHVLDLADWGAAERFSADVDQPGYDFITAIAALKEGERPVAQGVLNQLASRVRDDVPRLKIAHMELAALIALDGGDTGTAVGLLEQAAALEETLPFEFGPPASLMPPHEALGGAYMTAGRADEAMKAFGKALELTPGRMSSLVGLATAAREAGDEETASSVLERLSAQLRHADPAFRNRMGFAGGGPR